MDIRDSRPRYKDISGMRFGRLVAIKYVGKDMQNLSMWLCICDCGNTATTRASSLKSGSTKSCGCLQKEIAGLRTLTHGLSGSHAYCPRLYRIWKNMKQRCSNPKSCKYEIYGGNGVSVCDEWMEYEPFHKWAINHGYKKDLTLDRINGDGDYNPTNCRWATYSEQSLNTKQNRYLKYKDRSLTIKEWSDFVGIKYNTLRSRIFTYGWSIKKALETPVRIRRGNGHKISFS